MKNVPLRIALIIGSFAGHNTGHGGHYYSAMAIAQKLSEVHSVTIINVGDFPAAALKNSKVAVTYINIHFDAFANRSGLRKLLKSHKPDVVIAFDMRSGLLVRRLCIERSCGFILVKAGGPRFQQYSRNRFQIHFSPADADLASQLAKKHTGKIVCIPNRVVVPEQDWGAIEKLKLELSVQSDEIILIRIGRIYQGFRNIFMGSLRLAEFLRQLGYPARLIIIGICQQPYVLKEIQQRLHPKDAVLTSMEYTHNASRLLKIAQLNIGVARSFLEGCALGQYMFAMNSEDSLPTVVTQDNFHLFFQENFSMRVRFPHDSSKNEQSIITIADNCLRGNNISTESKRWFAEKFSVQPLLSLYEDILEQAKIHPETWNLDAMRSEYKFIKMSIKKITFNNLHKKLRFVIRRSLGKFFHSIKPIG